MVENKTWAALGVLAGGAVGIGLLAYWYISTRAAQAAVAPVVTPAVPPTDWSTILQETAETITGTKSTVGDILTEQQTCVANGYYWYDYGDGKGARCWLNPPP